MENIQSKVLIKKEGHLKNRALHLLKNVKKMEVMHKNP